MPPLAIAALALLAASGTDTLDVPALAGPPTLDGRVGAGEYGAPALRIATAAGEVRVWVGVWRGALHVAAALPDGTPYWGDDLVVSLDPDGSGDPAPAAGDRQWYLRRALDSSVVSVVAADEAGRWHAPGRAPATLGARRAGDGWAVASAGDAAGWSVELRVDAAALGGAGAGARRPRVAFRTYDDRPHGWWSWPAPPAGTPAVRVERSPALWVPLRLPAGR